MSHRRRRRALAIPSTVETRHGERGEGQSHIALHVIQHGLLADDTFLSLGATVVATTFAMLSQRTAAVTAAKAERVGFGDCGNCRKFILRLIRSVNRLFRAATLEGRHSRVSQLLSLTQTLLSRLKIVTYAKPEARRRCNCGCA